MNQLILCVIFFSLSNLTSSQIKNDGCCLEINSPTIMIAGANYSIQKKANNSSYKYILEGYGFSIKDSVTHYVVTPSFAINDLHYLDLKQIHKIDTTLIERKYFEVMKMPEPNVIWGEYGDMNEIYIHKDSLSKLGEISLINSWKTNFENPKIKDVTVYIRELDKKFSFDQNRLTDELINILNRPDSISTIDFYITYLTLQRQRYSFKSTKQVKVLSHDEYNKYYTPYYDLYKGKRVEVISTWLIQNSDTLELTNNNDLFIHCIGIGTENQFSLVGIDTGTHYEYSSWDTKTKLLDMRNEKGMFKVSFKGDAGSGDLILIIK